MEITNKQRINNMANMLRELDLEKNDIETIRAVLYYIARELNNIEKEMEK